MSIIDRLRDRAQRTAKSVLHLPLVADRVADDPRLERLAAETGLVPKRCGLCKHFSRTAYEETLRVQRAFKEASDCLLPTQMGTPSDAPALTPVSEAARALRPTLIERWADYGGCAKYGIALWAFAEQPPMPEPDSPPCGAWT